MQVCNPKKSHATHLIEHAELDKKTDKQLFMYEVSNSSGICYKKKRNSSGIL